MTSSPSGAAAPPRRFHLSIQWTLFAILSAIVLGGGGISIWLGYDLTSEAVIGEAQRRVEIDMHTAQLQYDHELERIASVTRFITLMQKTRDFLSRRSELDPRWVQTRLEEIRRSYRLDVLTLFDKDGKALLRTRFPYTTGDMVYVDPVIERALARQPAKGTVIVPAEVLEQEGQFLREQAFMEIVDTEMAMPTHKKVETSGMMLKAAEPVYDDEGGLLGYVTCGVLLNRNYAIPDAIRDTIFRNETYDGKPLGTVTLFQNDLRIATNVRKKNGARAIGTRVSRAVFEMTLENGTPWHDRAFVVNDWYLSAYDPIRDPGGKVIGILYVGVLEKKFLDYKSRLISSFVGIIIAGIILAIILSFTFSIWITRSLAGLGRTAAEMAQGNFLARVREDAVFRETARLNRAFNEMADSIVKRGNELILANRQLSRSNAELARLNENYMDMIEFVTHELKSPLASMIFGLNSIKDGFLGPVAPPQKEVIDQAEKNACYLNEMILNYLNLSRIEKNELHIAPEKIAFRRDVVEPVVEQVRPQLEAGGMRVEAEGIPGEVVVQGDVNLLKIVMDNLLSNAIKYGRQGSTILVGHHGPAGGYHRFNVRNEGVGIPRKDLDRLFQKFSRINIAELRFKKGTGLGLFITKEIVERHRGTIRVESEEGQWADFIFELPVPLEYSEVT